LTSSGFEITVVFFVKFTGKISFFYKEDFMLFVGLISALGGSSILFILGI